MKTLMLRQYKELPPKIQRKLLDDEIAKMRRGLPVFIHSGGTIWAFEIVAYRRPKLSEDEFRQYVDQWIQRESRLRLNRQWFFSNGEVAPDFIEPKVKWPSKRAERKWLRLQAVKRAIAREDRKRMEDIPEGHCLIKTSDYAPYPVTWCHAKVTA